MYNRSVPRDAFYYVWGDLLIYYDMILSTLSYLDDHIKESIDIEDVAKHYYFSKYHYYRIFKAVTGYTFSEYIDRKRLSLACCYLKQTSWTVLRVAIECGYNSHELLTRKFKKRFGMSPKQYRQSSCDIEAFSINYLIKREMINKKQSIVASYEIKTFDSRVIIGQKCNNRYDDAIDSRTIGNFLNDFSDECFDASPEGHLQLMVLSLEETSGDIEYFVGFDEVLLEHDYDQCFIEQSKFAVFKYKGLFRENIKTITQDIYQSIALSDWRLRDCGYEFIEIYDADYLDTLIFEIHVPVE